MVPRVNSVEREHMKLKQKKAPNVRKALSLKVAKRGNPTKSPTKQVSLIKARVVAVRTMADVTVRRHFRRTRVRARLRAEGETRARLTRSHGRRRP